MKKLVITLNEEGQFDIKNDGFTTIEKLGICKFMELQNEVIVYHKHIKPLIEKKDKK